MPVKEKTWTVLEIIKWGTTYLSEKGFDEARLTTELLLGAALDTKRFDLYVKHDQPLKKSELEKFKVLLKRRLAHEPVQYILGKTNFYSIELKTDRRALIPRPETEILAESVIEHCRSYLSQKEEIRLLDIGTGSGCIAVAVAKFVKNSVVTGIDISEDALSLARENAEAAVPERSVAFENADVLSQNTGIPGSPFDVIVSNPPYVSQSEFGTLAPDIREFEPHAALTDNSDGLRFYRRLVEIAPVLLRDGGWLFVETGFGQAKEVERLFVGNGAHETMIRKDLSGVDRVVRGRFFK